VAAVRVALLGAGGRMGQALVEATLGASDLALTGALDLPRSPARSPVPDAGTT